MSVFMQAAKSLAEEHHRGGPSEAADWVIIAFVMERTQNSQQGTDVYPNPLKEHVDLFCFKEMSFPM